jgi:8-oxo-dGTP diphosphatase
VALFTYGDVGHTKASDEIGMLADNRFHSHRLIPSSMTTLANTSATSKPWTLAVRAVVHDAQGRMLLLRRSNVCRNFVGCWEWPGGKVDPGEDFASAVTRETREETSLEVEITGLAGVTHFEAPAAHFVTLCMEVKTIGGEFKLSEEHDQHAWVAPTDFPKLPFTGQVTQFMLEYATRKGVAK